MYEIFVAKDSYECMQTPSASSNFDAFVDESFAAKVLHCIDINFV